MICGTSEKSMTLRNHYPWPWTHQIIPTNPTKMEDPFLKKSKIVGKTRAGKSLISVLSVLENIEWKNISRKHEIEILDFQFD